MIKKGNKMVAQVLDVRNSAEERKLVERVVKANNRLRGSKFIPNTPKIMRYREPKINKLV